MTATTGNTLIAPRRRRSIGLTALIDVVFILLMFYMLTSTFTQWKAVDFLSPSASKSQTADRPQLVILGADGSLALHGTDFALASFRLLDSRHLQAFDTGRAVVVLPQPDSSLQTLVSAVEHLKAVGFDKVTLGKTLDSTETP